MNITTGLAALDNLIGGGLQPGSLTLFAGTSQSGMTTLLDTTVAAAALKGGVPTLLADLESFDRNARILSAHSGVKLLSVQRAELTDEDGRRIAEAAATSSSGRLRHARSHDLPNLVADTIDFEPKLIAIDGVRYVAPGPGGDDDLASILVSLARLAHSHAAAVVVTAPMNRNQLHPGNAPSMAQLPREFELYCDTVVLIRRWGSLTPVEFEHAELFVVKNRNGDCGRVGVTADYTRARFLNEEPPGTSQAA